MAVVVTLDRVLKDRKLSAKEVADRIGLSETQLSLFRSNKVKGIRFATLSKLCSVLECKPGELLDYEFDEEDPSQGS